MLNIVLIAVVVLVAAVLIFAKTKPDTFHVQRSSNIKAPPAKIFPLINDLHSWAQWSPYEKLDPAMRKTHSGEPSGKGAVYAWEGNMKAGAGSVEIADTVPPSRVHIDLHMIKPFEGHNKVEFRLEPRRWYRCHVVHGREICLHYQGDGAIYEHGQNGWQPV